MSGICQVTKNNFRLLHQNHWTELFIIVFVDPILSRARSKKPNETQNHIPKFQFIDKDEIDDSIDDNVNQPADIETKPAAA